MASVSKIISLLVIVFFSVPLAAAQPDCPTIISAALETTASDCALTGPNQVCYGSADLTVSTEGPLGDVPFAQPGDRLDVSAVQRLDLSPLNLSDGTWAVALMRIQANLPAAETATLVLFGDVSVENTGRAVQLAASVAVPNQINVRSAPSTQGAVVRVLSPGAPVTVNGRSAAGDWLHLQLDDDGAGWVAAALLQAEGDLSRLSVVANDTPIYAPMQAFTLRTGSDDAGCAEAPNSGLLVQTPLDTASVQMQVNGVSLALTGTAFLQVEAAGRLDVNVLEGTAVVHALDKTATVPAGTFSAATLDETLWVNQAPGRPLPYAPETLQALPLQLLPRPIDIVEPLQPGQINRLTRCQVASALDATNFREGPAIAYFTTGTLTPNAPYPVIGWTTGTDGFVWWRVASNRWVRDDLVTTSGNCDYVAYTGDRPANPSTTGQSSDLACANERVIYADIGDVVPIAHWYHGGEYALGELLSRFFVDGTMIYEGTGAPAWGGSIVWEASWTVTTAGLHNVEVQVTRLVPAASGGNTEAYNIGDVSVFKICQIRVD